MLFIEVGAEVGRAVETGKQIGQFVGVRRTLRKVRCHILGASRVAELVVIDFDLVIKGVGNPINRRGEPTVRDDLGISLGRAAVIGSGVFLHHLVCKSRQSILFLQGFQIVAISDLVHRFSGGTLRQGGKERAFILHIANPQPLTVDTSLLEGFGDTGRDILAISGDDAIQQIVILQG